VTAADLLAEAEARGLRFRIAGPGDLRVGPPDKLDPTLTERLRARKAELLALLARPALPPQWPEWPARSVAAGDWGLHLATRRGPVTVAGALCRFTEPPAGRLYQGTRDFEMALGRRLERDAPTLGDLVRALGADLATVEVVGLGLDDGEVN
jgi:hypothetical protein